MCQAQFTSVDQALITSVAGGAQVTMSNGNLSGAVPATDPIEAQPYMKPCSIPVALNFTAQYITCLLYTSPSPRDATLSRMPSSA